jgi:hypothetical protein
MGARAGSSLRRRQIFISKDERLIAQIKVCGRTDVPFHFALFPCIINGIEG